MKLYLAADSSLELIRHLRLENGEEGLVGTAVRRRTLNNSINSVHGMRELDPVAQSWLEHVSRPIHAFVDKRSRGTSTKQLKTSVFGLEVPYGAFLDIGHGICICTPAYTFMQLSMRLETAELLQVGMELCGTYGRLQPGQARTETQGCAYGLPPAMNAKPIGAFTERMGGHIGSRKARAAARWLVNGSASPTETATYLLLCLPKRLGGYGLPQPLFNPPIIMDGPDGMEQRRPDLFWLEGNIDVEFGDDFGHSGEWVRSRDSLSEMEYTVTELRVLPLTLAQLLDVDAFDAFANGIRRMLGIRTRPRHPDWEHRRAELRRILLAGYPA